VIVHEKSCNKWLLSFNILKFAWS